MCYTHYLVSVSQTTLSVRWHKWPRFTYKETEAWPHLRNDSSNACIGKARNQFQKTTWDVPSFAAKKTSRDRWSLPDDLGRVPSLTPTPGKRHARRMQLPHPSWGAVLSPMLKIPPGTHSPQKKRRQIIVLPLRIRFWWNSGLGSLNDWPWNQPGPSPPPRFLGLLLLLLNSGQEEKDSSVISGMLFSLSSFPFLHIWRKPTHVWPLYFFKETFFPLSQLKMPGPEANTLSISRTP